MGSESRDALPDHSALPLGGDALGSYRDAWKARGRELNALYEVIEDAVAEPTPDNPLTDLGVLVAERDRLRAENTTLKEEQVSFVRALEQVQAENEALRKAAAPVVGRCEAATRIIGRDDFREVRVFDVEWRRLKVALQSDDLGATR